MCGREGEKIRILVVGWQLHMGIIEVRFVCLELKHGIAQVLFPCFVQLVTMVTGMAIRELGNNSCN